MLGEGRFESIAESNEYFKFVCADMGRKTKEKIPIPYVPPPQLSPLLFPIIPP